MARPDTSGLPAGARLAGSRPATPTIRGARAKPSTFQGLASDHAATGRHRMVAGPECDVKPAGNVLQDREKPCAGAASYSVRLHRAASSRQRRRRHGGAPARALCWRCVCLCVLAHPMLALRVPAVRAAAVHACVVRVACTCCACACCACLRCARMRFPCSRCVHLLCVPLLCVPARCAFVLVVWCACAALAYIVRSSPTPHPSPTPAT